MICSSNYVLDSGGSFNVVVLKYKSIDGVFILPNDKKGNNIKAMNSSLFFQNEIPLKAARYSSDVSQCFFLGLHGLANRTIAPLPLAECPLQACYSALLLGLPPLKLQHVKCLPCSWWRMTLHGRCTRQHMQRHEIISLFKHFPNIPDAFVS